MSSQQTTPHQSHPPLKTSTVLLMAIATGFIVGCNYLIQPLIVQTGSDFHVPADYTGFFITLSQISYAIGLVFIVPLGNLYNNRKLISRLFAAAAVALFAIAAAPTLPILLIALAIMGCLCVSAQLIVAYASTISLPSNRGRVIGTIMSGLLSGILLSRTVSGSIAQLSSWRTVYVVAGIAIALLAYFLHKQLPQQPDNHNTSNSYWHTIKQVWIGLFNTPILRHRSLIGALDFSLFSILWTTLTLLLEKPPYSYNVATIGFFGLLGIVGVAGATLSGRFADRGLGYRISLISAIAHVLSWALLFMGQTQLAGLILGILLLDFAVQATHIINQTIIYRDDPQPTTADAPPKPSEKGKITSAYMSSYFFGGVVGSFLATYCYIHWQWLGVCALGFVIACVLLYLTVRYRHEH